MKRSRFNRHQTSAPWQPAKGSEAAKGQETVLHEPAMVEEVVHFLGCREKRGGVWVDMTVGTGGHALAILQAAPEAVLIGIDKDLESLTIAAERLEPFAERVKLIQGDFRDVQRLIRQCGYEQVDGCLMDPGMSLYQVKSNRGLSFERDEELDMRYDRSQTLTAKDLVNKLSVEELTELFEKGGEGRRRAHKIATAIAQMHQHHSIETTAQLAALIEAVVGRRKGRQRLHPATKAFMALRMAVNDEADALEQGTKAALQALKIGARFVALSYQSIEDRLIKQTLKQHQQPVRESALPSLEWGGGVVVRLLTPKPVRPSPEEIRRNPRARSCKLRAAERIA